MTGRRPVVGNNFVGDNFWFRFRSRKETLVESSDLVKSSHLVKVMSVIFVSFQSSASIDSSRSLLVSLDWVTAF